MNNFGKNLTWFLDELANSEADQLEDGEIEIFGEDEHGREGFCMIDVTDLARAAKDKIASLEHALTQVHEIASRDSEHFGKARSDIAERAKESLETQ